MDNKHDQQRRALLNPLAYVTGTGVAGVKYAIRIETVHAGLRLGHSGLIFPESTFVRFGIQAQCRSQSFLIVVPLRLVPGKGIRLDLNGNGHWFIEHKPPGFLKKLFRQRRNVRSVDHFIGQGIKQGQICLGMLFHIVSTSYANTSNAAPCSTRWPATAATERTTPARSERISFSIFMASRITSG